jgi:hypothetical protein
MDSWHTWLLLRPLIVFTMACPAFVFAALLGLRKKPSETEKSAPTRANQSPRFMLSASGVWRIQEDGLSPPLSSSDPRRQLKGAQRKCRADTFIGVSRA